ncbi:hypothetical protein AB0M97_30700 [Streptomyces sp. NPDC051207]|uniref:hypothetical protein n=1 Tax=Streptomyces sp. NPDC051207 TaxID=3154641 RepID=UPI0034241761
MMYAFLTGGGGVLERMSAILAEAFDVPAADIDVSDASELESRNWDALVTCEYEFIAGDLQWSLSIYAAEEVKHQLSEADLALHVARRLDVPVFFAWRGEVPWIRRVALPDGGLTLARVAEQDDQPGFYVEAAEAPIAGLPDVRVMHLPEVVRAFGIPTPVTDAVAPRGVGDTQERIRGLLVNWERLCVRLRSNWPPNNWYSAAMYKEDLEYRDSLDVLLRDLPETEREKFGEALRELDSQYRELTIDDGGQAVGALGSNAVDLAGRAWYWRRRPQVLPWASGEPR